ncbi:MAG: ABC transporter substrate-binding protein [Thermodesulfobacteriota bacterium]
MKAEQTIMASQETANYGGLGSGNDELQCAAPRHCGFSRFRQTIVAGQSRICLALLLALFPVACSGPPPEPVKIGLSINLSGRGGSPGEHIRDGAMLAVMESNENGGINGRPLQLLVRDDENSVEGVRRADQGLIDEGVVAIIGHSFSDNTVNAYPLVTSQNVLLLTGYTATNQLSGKDDLFFRTSVDCILYGKKTAALFRREGIESVAVLMDMANSGFSLDYVEQLRAHFVGTIREARFDSSGRIDWPAMADALLVPAPDAVLLLTEVSMTGIAARTIRGRNYDGPLVATTWAQAPGLLHYGGPAVEGMSLVTFIREDIATPRYHAFAARLQQEFGRPASARSARGYELVEVLVDALRRCETISAAELKKQLAARPYQTVMGKLEFDRSGDVIRPIYEVVVENGRFRTRGEI